MNAKPPLYRSDIRPLEFTLAVILGGIGSAVLSGLRVHPMWSVGFALLVMGVLAFLRWRIASEFKDFQSLEAFAEDIYLLGYLLTLAALLGLAPRLMSDDTNLFHIAGLKLVTTVVGLALMMIFRQMARRWAQEGEQGAIEEFEKQQRLFSEAVANLNQRADELTSKLAEVICRFDPAVLIPVAEWSNRAAAAFSTASKALEKVPDALEAGKSNLEALSGQLEYAKSAAGELAGVLTAGTAQAANVLTTELGRAKEAIGQLGPTVAGLQPASETAGKAIQKLGNQAEADAGKLAGMGNSFLATVEELKKAERTLKKLLDLHAVDSETPINRLVQALDTSAAKTTAAAERFENIQRDLRDTTIAIQGLAKQIDSQAAARTADSAAATKQLVTQLGELRTEIGQTNAQLRALIVRPDGAPPPETKTSFFGGIFGRGSR